jgi:putative YhdH/YhfP family quinone oxidoreductase
MSAPQNFNALIVRETAHGKFTREVARKSITDLPDGDLLVEVRYSSLNYKDALSATGHRGVTRSYPHTPGIDAAGIVVESASPQRRSGDPVIVTGFDLGMNTSGGFGRYIRVPASWAIKLPENLALKESMVYGTAGLTAALAVLALQDHGVKPGQGDVLVTGATGGLGSLAVGLLARSGYGVVASTGKESEKEYLTRLGAAEIVSREALNDTSGRPLLKARWAGAVDTVGGNTLATAIKSTQPGGAVAACGNVASADLPITVYPFILRGVSVLGIGSAECPMERRLQAWNKIAGEWKLENLALLYSECSLEDLDGKIGEILQGKIRGRVVVKLAD